MNKVINKNTQSLVSVIVRTKNWPATLVYSLESVIKQTYHAIEIILINGGDIFSTDISDYLKNIEMPVTIMLDVLGDEIFELDFDANNVTELMSLVVNKKIDIGELTHSLSVEDEFSGNQELNVLDFYE